MNMLLQNLPHESNKIDLVYLYDLFLSVDLLDIQPFINRKIENVQRQ